MKISKSLLFGVAHATPCLSSTVTLKDYGSFTGTTINSTLSGATLPQLVDAWLGIDYATQPANTERFKPVGWPAPFNGTKSATKYGKRCIQPASAVSADDQDEACLNFNVFRPSNISLEEKLPVLVWIHGGSFFTGGWNSFDGASFVASSKNPVVVVNFHYRLGSFGSLPSALFEEEDLLNLGLRDQKLLLQFVQKHIGSFGGDRESVTLGGLSAGGHSVGIHYFHNYGEDEGKPLFAQAFLQSGSPTARAFPNSHSEINKEQFVAFLTGVGCDKENDNQATLECLRSIDIGAIRTVSDGINSNYSRYVNKPFQPVTGGPLLEKPGSQSGYDGTFFHIPIITSSTTDEGKAFVPGDIETNEDFIDYFHKGSPDLDQTDLALLGSLYADPLTIPSSPYGNSPNSTQYNRLAAAWSDYAYICPVQETAYRTALAGVPTWKLRFNGNNSFPAWKGIPHAADYQAVWDEPVSVKYRDISHIYHAYIASFVTTGNPNKERYPGSPQWPQYHPGSVKNYENKPLQLVIEQEGRTTVEVDERRKEACLYWRDPERAPRLNK